MAILSGSEIRAQVAAGKIKCTPYDAKNVQPNSIDVTLGTGVCVYRETVYTPMPPRGPARWTSYAASRELGNYQGADLDVRKVNDVVNFTMDESGWLVRPGILYLMHVVEVLHAPKLVMTLDGKSSLARLGLIVHFTAGHAETGFDGQYTMEVSAMHTLRIYPGMSIAQVIFNTVEGSVEDYKKRGNYVGTAALGAQPSRSWKQFES